ncbi:Imm49 family immunity protein [Enterovibrio norvegicus]|uniref:Imm49 family immunity protein n=1 Tax=Enterovibrio norvegicus TaxID=188144 RepID=UPI0002D405A8|nr:Imm49 family immunity protein [Enterovibrio norvegicus]
MGDEEMKSIESHKKNLDGLARVYDSHLKSLTRYKTHFVQDTSRDEFNLEAVATNELKCFCLGGYLEKVSEDALREHLLNAQHFTIMMQRRNQVPQDEVFPFCYGGREFKLKGHKGRLPIEAPDWFDSVALTIIADKFEDLNDLMAVEEHGLLEYRSKQTQLAIDLRLHCLGLKPSPEPEALLEAFLAEINVNQKIPEKKELALGGLTITLGFFDVMRAIHAKDETDYRQAMFKAVEMHKEWFTHDEDFSSRMIGYVSLPLLTAAKYAYAKYGFTLDFETPYLPIYVKIRGQTL